MSKTESYLSFFLSLGDIAPQSLLALFFLTLMRIAPVVVMAPFFGSKTPSSVKMGLLVALAVIVLPHSIVSSPIYVGFDTEFLFLCMKELFIGFFLAFFVSIPFYIAQSSGIMIDFLRGSSALQVTDPSTQSQASDLGLLYNLVLIVLFYEIDGPWHFFNALFDSYTLLPASQWLPLSFFSFEAPLWQATWNSVNTVMAIGIQLAAPSLLAILMTETFLGIANRLAPQVQIAFLGMSLKSLVGLGILALAWLFILKQMQKQTLLWLHEIKKLVFSLAA